MGEYFSIYPFKSHFHTLALPRSLLFHSKASVGSGRNRSLQLLNSRTRPTTNPTLPSPPPPSLPPSPPPSLQGHLSALAVTDLYDYLTQGHDPTTVGIFLGMAASKRGTADSTVRCPFPPSLPPSLPFSLLFSYAFVSFLSLPSLPSLSRCPKCCACTSPPSSPSLKSRSRPSRRQQQSWRWACFIKGQLTGL